MISLCKSLETADYVQAQRLHAALSSTEWDSSNKNWLVRDVASLPFPAEGVRERSEAMDKARIASLE